MNINKKNQFSFSYLLKKKTQMLQFYLLKYLKYNDLIKLKKISKDGINLCDANTIQADSF